MDLLWTDSDLDRNSDSESDSEEEDDLIEFDEGVSRKLRHWVINSKIPREDIDVLFKILHKYRGIQFPTDFISLNDMILREMNNQKCIEKQPKEMVVFPITKEKSDKILRKLYKDANLYETVKEKFIQDGSTITSIEDGEKFFKSYFSDDFVIQYYGEQFSKYTGKCYKNEELFKLLFRSWKSEIHSIEDWEKIFGVYIKKTRKKNYISNVRKKKKAAKKE